MQDLEDKTAEHEIQLFDFSSFWVPEDKTTSEIANEEAPAKPRVLKVRQLTPFHTTQASQRESARVLSNPKSLLSARSISPRSRMSDSENVPPGNTASFKDTQTSNRFAKNFTQQPNHPHQHMRARETNPTGLFNQVAHGFCQ
ncbi:hypothetical protein RvY_07319 [Ramazzottius varieornatus]|uniref:Uncharacterized protein n=1 Tax=Ramazzottius varieornatus TaxID=947166 RepID=A0A1D1VA70_RAMVA|nr:hypothetical protein RvY_07319 [Ramazzottius varieornatus]